MVGYASCSGMTYTHIENTNCMRWDINNNKKEEDIKSGGKWDMWGMWGDVGEYMGEMWVDVCGDLRVCVGCRDVEGCVWGCVRRMCWGVWGMCVWIVEDVGDVLWGYWGICGGCVRGMLGDGGGGDVGKCVRGK